MRRRVLALLTLLVAGYGGVCLGLYLYQDKLVYFPDPTVSHSPADAGLAFQEHWIDTSDSERLHAWWVPAANPGAPALLFLHGNAGNMSQRLDSLRIFHELGLSSLIVDYRGYGHSSGKPDEQGTYRDGQAAYQFMRHNLGIPAQRLLIFGRSLGGGIATWLATRNDCLGVIIESSFISVPRLGQEVYPWLPVRWLARIRYNNAARMAHLRCPVLVIHSRDDRLIPFHHGRRLHELAPPAKAFLELSGTHNNGFLVSSQRYRSGLSNFLKALDGTRVQSQ